MKMEDYNYHLPEELIAQTPLTDRTASKLMVLNKESKEITHDIFSNIGTYLKQGDCLVLNNSRVIPVRLYGTKRDTKAKIEILLLHEIEQNIWEALVKPAKKVKIGTVIAFGDGKLLATCIQEKQQGAKLFRLSFKGILLEDLEQLGEMPLPPYIKTELKDDERYQTVYAKENGSAAAPTAGLHFSNELLQHIKSQGVQIVYITLHVGLGTFRPITAEHIEDHQMHAEYYHIYEKPALILNQNRETQG